LPRVERLTSNVDHRTTNDRKEPQTAIQINACVAKLVSKLAAGTAEA
jgi:hypothetical protein